MGLNTAAVLFPARTRLTATLWLRSELLRAVEVSFPCCLPRLFGLLLLFWGRFRIVLHLLRVGLCNLESVVQTLQLLCSHSYFLFLGLLLAAHPAVQEVRGYVGNLSTSPHVSNARIIVRVTGRWFGHRGRLVLNGRSRLWHWKIV